MKMKLDLQFFASGTISETSAPSNGDVRIVWSSTKNDTTNTSTVTAKVEVEALREDKKIVTMNTTCTNQRGEVVIKGTAVLLHRV